MKKGGISAALSVFLVKAEPYIMPPMPPPVLACEAGQKENMGGNDKGNKQKGRHLCRPFRVSCEG